MASHLVAMPLLAYSIAWLLGPEVGATVGATAAAISLHMLCGDSPLEQQMRFPFQWAYPLVLCSSGWVAVPASARQQVHMRCMVACIHDCEA
jgi:hypothetical protein